ALVPEGLDLGIGHVVLRRDLAELPDVQVGRRRVVHRATRGVDVAFGGVRIHLGALLRGAGRTRRTRRGTAAVIALGTQDTDSQREKQQRDQASFHGSTSSTDRMGYLL